EVAGGRVRFGSLDAPYPHLQQQVAGDAAAALRHWCIRRIATAYRRSSMPQVCPRRLRGSFAAKSVGPVSRCRGLPQFMAWRLAIRRAGSEIRQPPVVARSMLGQHSSRQDPRGAHMVGARTEVHGYAHTHRLSFLSGLATTWVFAVMLALVLQRQVIVLVEDASRGVSWLTAAFALRRRLDDASFWGMFCVFVAGVLAFRAACRIECMTRFEPREKRMRWLWSLPAAILPSIAYLLYVRDQGQTLWYVGSEPAKVMAQRLEGALVLSVILAAAVIFAVHLSAVRVLRQIVKDRMTKGQRIEEPQRRAASLLISVAAGPHLSAGVGWAVYSIFAFLAYSLG